MSLYRLQQYVMKCQISRRALLALVMVATSALARPQQQAQLVRQGPCHAAVFAGWKLTPGPNGQTADVFGPNGAYAGWGIVAVNPAMRQYYGAMYGPPEEHTVAILTQLLHTQPQFTSSKNIGGFFTAHEFRAGNKTGIVLYHVYPAAMGQYIISEYFAWAPPSDAALLSQAKAVMTSLQCTSSVRPPSATYTPHPGGTSGKKGGGSSEDDNLKDYNSILGTQWAHDANGTLYYLDAAKQWSDNGPDGPGYYAGSGVNRHKLTPGVE